MPTSPNCPLPLWLPVLPAGLHAASLSSGIYALYVLCYDANCGYVKRVVINASCGALAAAAKAPYWHQLDGMLGMLVVPQLPMTLDEWVVSGAGCQHIDHATLAAMPRT
jgi:hypothetical protein